MKNLKIILITILLLSLSFSIFAQDKEGIISIYAGSEIIYDDLMGYDELPVIINEDELKLIEGDIRRQWCQAPEGRSAFEIIKNYENTIKNMGGEVLFLTRDPQPILVNEIYFEDYFQKIRVDHGLASGIQLSHTYFPGQINGYLVGKITVSETDIYTIVAVGNGLDTFNLDNTTFYELITIEAEAIEMDMVTVDSLQKGIESSGRAEIYNIYFESGEAKIKEDSAEALATTAEFLKENPDKRYLVVGHTDNTGSYMINMNLSNLRAEAVVEKLIAEYNINKNQLIPVGVGPASPLSSNSTEEGRSKNRRVEIVEI